MIIMKKVCDIRMAVVAVLLLATAMAGNAAERTIKVYKRYLNFPVSHKVDRKQMKMTVGTADYCKFVVRLTAGEPDYWVFQDVSELKGKTVTLTFDGADDALQKIYQDDTFPGKDEVYNEPNRPQYHFTTRRGWINDPNGCVYDAVNGEYHLFYQHNPYEREWENMHWGHAVSKDLLHWQELPDALHPDSIGTMFSGSAWIDYHNSAGLNIAAKKNKKGQTIVAQQPAMIAYYTADHPNYQRQCMAYSLDNGRTFTKYEGNPVIDSHEKWQSHDTRDPKIFWYAPGNHWVLVLNERDGNTIYNSDDLKHWTAMSHITGFWECPELFRLNADDGSSHWVMWGASGTYMTGSFDGKTFTPDGPKRMNLNGSAYAAQCINQAPETIKMSWGRIDFDDMPVNGCMLLPQKQTLKKTSQGLLLYSYPIGAVDQLFDKAFEAENLSAEEANRALEQFYGNEELRIKATVRMTYATDLSLSYKGRRLFDYDMNGNRLQGDFYINPITPGTMVVDIDLFVDHAIVEGFVDGGAFSYSMRRDVRSDSKESYCFRGNQLKIEKLQVYKAKSIWH